MGLMTIFSNVKTVLFSSISDSSQANPNDVVEGVLTKALSGGKAKREKAARKAEARKQEASSAAFDAHLDSPAKPGTEKSDEVMEKLYKSLKEAEAHGLLQGLGKEMMREFAKEIAATTSPTVSKNNGEAAAKAPKPHPPSAVPTSKQQQQQQQPPPPTAEETDSNQGKSKKKKKANAVNASVANGTNPNEKKKTAENLASQQKASPVSVTPNGNPSHLSKDNQRYTNGNPSTSKPQPTQSLPKKDNQVRHMETMAMLWA